MNDLKFAIRSLVKTPGFTLIAIITLALGIGMNTSMFSLMNTLLLRPLRFAEPERLVHLYRVSPQGRGSGFASADYFDLRREQAGFGRFAGYFFSSVAMAPMGRPAEWQNTLRVSADFFEVLGVQPELGRFFRPEEEVNGSHRVLVISHGLWQDRFDGAANVIGQAVRCNGEAYEIVGVLPASAEDRRLFGNARVFRPFGFTDEERTRRNMHFVNVLGRRDAALSPKQGATFVAALGARVAKNFPQENAQVGWSMEGLRESTMNPRGRVLLMMLLGLSGFVLLIACSNLANFLLARTMERAREFAVRAAIGASRLQLLRPLAAESLALAAAGGAGALLVAVWTTDWLRAQAAKAGESTLGQLGMDGRVLGFAIGISALTVMFFGIAPALFAARLDLNDALKTGIRGSTASRGHERFRRCLIAGQFSLAMILLAGAGYFVRGSENALKQYRGWDSDHVVQGMVELPGGKYKTDAAVIAFWRQAIERLQKSPGVKAASASYGLPFKGMPAGSRYLVEGGGAPDSGHELAATKNGISPDYFETAGTRILAGRPFAESDARTSPRVVIINETMAKALFPNENPLGHRLAHAGSNPLDWAEIVAVASDVQSVDVAHKPEGFQVYEPLPQDVWYYGEGKPSPIFFAVRSEDLTTESALKTLQAAIMEIDPDLPIRDLISANRVVERVSSQMSLFRQLLSGFALLGLLLAGLGVYGVIARTVAQRTAEIGVRMALGAQVRDVIGLVLGSGLRLALAGAAIGFFGAYGLARLLSSILPGMKINDGLVQIAATAVLVLIALVACYLPARKASKIDPMTALRTE